MAVNVLRWVKTSFLHGSTALVGLGLLYDFNVFHPEVLSKAILGYYM